MVSPLIYLATRLHQYSMFDKEVQYSIGQKAHQGKHENLSLDIHLSSVFGVYLDIICPKGDFPTVLGWNQFYLRVKHPENESKTGLEKEDAFSLPYFFFRKNLSI